jgi:hypothetical protein
MCEKTRSRLWYTRNLITSTWQSPLIEKQNQPSNVDKKTCTSHDSDADNCNQPKICLLTFFSCKEDPIQTQTLVLSSGHCSKHGIDCLANDTVILHIIFVPQSHTPQMAWDNFLKKHLTWLCDEHKNISQTSSCLSMSWLQNKWTLMSRTKFREYLIQCQLVQIEKSVSSRDWAKKR